MSHVEDWLAQASARKVLGIGNDMWVNNEKIVIINDIFVVANLLYKNWPWIEKRTKSEYGNILNRFFNKSTYHNMLDYVPYAVL